MNHTDVKGGSSYPFSSKNPSQYLENLTITKNMDNGKSLSAIDVDSKLVNVSVRKNLQQIHIGLDGTPVIVKRTSKKSKMQTEQSNKTNALQYGDKITKS